MASARPNRHWPGWEHDIRIAKDHADAILGYLTEPLKRYPAEEIVEHALRIYGAHLGYTTKVVTPFDVLLMIRAFLQSLGLWTSWESGATVLRDLYSEGYVTSAFVADKMLNVAVAWDLQNWRSQAQLMGEDGGRGLAGLLADAGKWIRGMNDTTIDRLAEVLAQGIAAGDPAREIAKAINDLIDDPDRAYLIAQTETARAMVAASYDEYRLAGITTKVFQTAEDDRVCPECEANEAEGEIPITQDFGNGDPPVHPLCRCALLPGDSEFANLTGAEA